MQVAIHLQDHNEWVDEVGGAYFVLFRGGVSGGISLVSEGWVECVSGRKPSAELE